MTDQLSGLFRPASVAVVGASTKDGKWGNIIVGHIKNAYRGPIYPINPNTTHVLGLPAYPSIKDLPEIPDLVIIGIAKDGVAKVVEECALAGCKVAVIVTSGFAETGEEGRRNQESLVEAARSGGMRLVGPNCMGVYSAESGLYASVALNPGSVGGVAVLSQSGNVGVAMFQALQAQRVGMHSFIGVGNQADVSMVELIEYLMTDQGCTMIVAYVEGVVDGKELLRVLRRDGAKKPVLVLHGGYGKTGAQAARSHTGALATEGRLLRDLLHQCGAIVAEDLDDLIATALVFSKTPLRPSRRVAMITDGGGFGVLAADQLDRAGLVMASIEERTRASLRAVMPPHCSVENPVDVGGDSDSDPSVFGVAATVLLQDPEVDALLVSGIIGGYAPTFNEAFEDVELQAADTIAQAAQRHTKPVVVQSVWPVEKTPVLSRLDQLGVPVLESLSGAVRSLANLDRYVNRASRIQKLPPVRLPVPEGAPGATDVSGLATQRSWNEAAIYRLLERNGLSVPKFSVVDNEADAVSAADEIGYPVVVKALVVAEHKSELGGVIVGVSDEKAVVNSVRLLHRLSDEVLIAAQKWGVAEVLVGGMYSDQFGPVVTVGVGGLLTEAMDDVSFASAPVSPGEVSALLLRNGALSRILTTKRRGRALAIDRLVETVVVVSNLLTEAPVQIGIELNPVILDEEDAWVVDAKLRREDAKLRLEEGSTSGRA